MERTERTSRACGGHGAQMEGIHEGGGHAQRANGAHSTSRACGGHGAQMEGTHEGGRRAHLCTHQFPFLPSAFPMLVAHGLPQAVRSQR